ncbi:MAG: hypothetical protein JW839_03575, partial [Candidatus Lokiarchaeota archaeon]|nr:hypothetical protein [Candidatus Lokiarchaeota archaeon]
MEQIKTHPTRAYIRMVTIEQTSHLQSKDLQRSCISNLLLCESYFLFEVQGEQHYQFIDFFHRKEERFKNSIANDACKQDRCITNQTVLFLIPYWIPDQKVKDHILKEVEEKDLVSLLI